MRRVPILSIVATSYILAQTATIDNVAQLYVAYFDRAPEQAGLHYWVDESRLSLEDIAKSFFDQEETKKMYPSKLTTDEFIKAVYRNLFNREPDRKGLEYWRDEIDIGNISRDVFILAIINGALGDDRVIMNNKKEIALYFANSGIDDTRVARFAVAGIDESSKSIKVSESMLDDFVKGRQVVDYGIDKKDEYFLFDINNSTYSYKLDNCQFIDINTTFSYNIYSDNSADITIKEGDNIKSYPCTIAKKMKITNAQDGKILAPFIKKFTGYDKNHKLFYKLNHFYNGNIVEIYDNGTKAKSVDIKGYTIKNNILATLENIPLSHRGLKPLSEDEHIVDYGSMKNSQRDLITDAEGDLFVYKAGACIFPINDNTIYDYKIYDDNTIKISFTENGENITSRCGIQNRYLKIDPTDSNSVEAYRISNSDNIYYDTKTETYYISDPIYRGTITKIYADGQGAIIKDSRGYSYQKAIYSAYRYKPLAYIGEISQDRFNNIEDSGYMRVSQQTALYDLKGEKYSYLTKGCIFPKDKNGIYRFFVSTNGDVILTDINGYTVSNCKVIKKYKLLKRENIDNLNAYSIDQDGFYFSQGRYYRSVYFANSTIVYIFGNGQIAYIKDTKGYYHWEPIFEILEPIQ